MTFVEIVNAAIIVGSVLTDLDGKAQTALPLLEQAANEATKRNDEFCASIYNLIVEDVRSQRKRD